MGRAGTADLQPRLVRRLERRLRWPYFVGAAGLALTVFAVANHGALNDAAVATAYVRIAAAKVALPFGEAFLKGVLCNLLVCLAVWLTLAGRSVTDKILAIVFPVAAFVAAGFDHRVANMYLSASSMGLVAVDVNSASQQELETISGMRPAQLAHLGAPELVAVTAGQHRRGVMAGRRQSIS